MAVKFGIGLVLLVFGSLMFLAGAIAPEHLRQPLGQWLATAMGPGAREGALALPAVIVAPAAVKTATAVPMAAVGPAAAAPDPILADTLLIPTPLPDKAQYALQAGQFTSGDAADALAQRIKSLFLPSTPVIEVVDRAGMRSRIVPVGPYASLAEARMAGATVARELGLAGPLPLMLLPSPVPAKAAPAPAGASR